jgi:choline dehydrogenase-like flavoprotein
MIRDLDLNPGATTHEADVCVIGSGPAGLSVARALVDQGMRVVIVEAGPMTPVLRDAPGTIESTRRAYPGGTRGRAFGLGGTSALWGGQLLPLREHETRSRPSVGAIAWPAAYAEISRHYATLLRWTGVDEAPFGMRDPGALSHPATHLDWEGFEPRFSKWIPFRHRNLARSWLPRMLSTGRLQVYVNAEVMRWQGQSGPGATCVADLHAIAPQGGRLQVRARHFVICAGALESPRLVLEMLEQLQIEPAPIGPSRVGQFLQDHLSLRVAQFRMHDRRRFAKLFAPFFTGTTMQSLRIELPTTAAQGAALPSCYAHFILDTPADSGFAALRDTLRSLQAGRIHDALRNAGKMAAATPEILEILHARFLCHRLVVPRRSTVFLHLDFEQPQREQNRVQRGLMRDATGRRKLVIDWDVACDPEPIVREMRARFESFWQKNRLDDVAQPAFLDMQAIRERWPNNVYDIYHPAGTLRMASSSSPGSVDENLRVFGTDNCYVVSSAVFPSMGSANPTLTIMALGLRLAERLSGVNQACANGDPGRR